VEVENRARQIARSEVQAAQLLVQQVEQRWNRRLTFAGIVISAVALLIVGFFTWHSPIARLDTKIDLVRDEFTKTNTMDGRLTKLEQDGVTTAGDVKALSQKVSLLEGTSKRLEKNSK